MKFYRKFIDEKGIIEISKEEYREILSLHYKNVACFIDTYYNEERPIRTTFYYLWCEE